MVHVRARRACVCVCLLERGLPRAGGTRCRTTPCIRGTRREWHGGARTRSAKAVASASEAETRKRLDERRYSSTDGSCDLKVLLLRASMYGCERSTPNTEKPAWRSSTSEKHRPRRPTPAVAAAAAAAADVVSGRTQRALLALDRSLSPVHSIFRWQIVPSTATLLDRDSAMDCRWRGARSTMARGGGGRDTRATRESESARDERRERLTARYLLTHHYPSLVIWRSFRSTRKESRYRTRRKRTDGLLTGEQGHGLERRVAANTSARGQTVREWQHCRREGAPDGSVSRPRR